MFVDEAQYNQTIRFEGLSTITALEYTGGYKMLYLANNEGYIKVFEVKFGGSEVNSSSSKEI